MGYLLDDLNLISLSLFFLVFSALEISTGLVTILLQKNIFKTTNTYLNYYKFNFFNKKNKRLFFNKKLL